MNVLSWGHLHLMPHAQRRRPGTYGHPVLRDAALALVANLALVGLIETLAGSGLQGTLHPLHVATLALAAFAVAASTAHVHATRAVHAYMLLALTFMLQVALAVAWNLGVLWVLRG